MEDPQPRRLLPSPHTTTPQHTWHHSDQVLLELIRGGSDFPQTRMPAFRQTLTDAETTAILECLKSNWGLQERAYQWQITWQEGSVTPGPRRPARPGLPGPLPAPGALWRWPGRGGASCRRRLASWR